MENNLIYKKLDVVQGSQEWLDARLNYVTATDDLSDSCLRAKLYPESKAASAAMRRGTERQSEILKKYIRSLCAEYEVDNEKDLQVASGIVIEPSDAFFASEQEHTKFMACSPDALDFWKGRLVEVIEIKSYSQKSYDERRKNNFASERRQMLHNCIVLSVRKATLVIEIVETGDIKVIPHYIEAEDEANRIDACRAFYNNLQEQKKLLFNFEVDELELDSIAEKYLELSDVIKKLESEQKALKQAIHGSLGACVSYRTSNYIVNNSTFSTYRFDTDSFKSENKELYNKYIKESHSSRLTIKKIGE